MDKKYIEYLMRHFNMTEEQAKEWYGYFQGWIVMPDGMHQYLRAIDKRIGMSGDVMMECMAEFIKIRDGNWVPLDEWSREFVESCYADIQWTETILQRLKRYLLTMKRHPDYWAGYWKPYSKREK
jgi:hypothetical protein